MKEEDWNLIVKIPPDELLKVKDNNGNEGLAYPTWYPFKVVRQPPFTRWSSKIEPCEPYWDGGWLVECEGLGPGPITGNITHWKMFSSPTP